MSAAKKGGLAADVSAFAAVLLIVVGVLQGFAGLAAWAKKGTGVYAATSDHSYFLHLNTTSWGWLHIVLGVVIFFAGVGIASGQTWARAVGIVVAAVSAVTNFAFVPIYPVWAILLIALDVLIIWALTTYHGKVV